MENTSCSCPSLLVSWVHPDMTDAMALKKGRFIFSPNSLIKPWTTVPFISLFLSNLRLFAPLASRAAPDFPLMFQNDAVVCLRLPASAAVEPHAAKISRSLRLQYCCSNNINGGETIHGQNGSVKLNFFLCSWHSHSKFGSENAKRALSYSTCCFLL